MSFRSASFISVGVVVASVGGCLTVDLDGHACPCVDGFACVDDVCVADDTLPSCATEACPDGLQCIDDSCSAEPATCPASFTATSGCGVVPASATLVGVCDDGQTLPRALADEVGFAVFGSCATGGGVTARVTAVDVAGDVSFDNDAEVLNFNVVGTVTFDIDVPDECVVAGCAASDGSGVCGAAVGGGCHCSDVVLEFAPEPLDRINSGTGTYQGEDLWVGCDDGDQFVLRGNDTTSLGLTFLFQP